MTVKEKETQLNKLLRDLVAAHPENKLYPAELKNSNNKLKEMERVNCPSINPRTGDQCDSLAGHKGEHCKSNWDISGEHRSWWKDDTVPPAEKCPEELNGKCTVEQVLPGCQCDNCCKYCADKCKAVCQA